MEHVVRPLSNHSSVYRGFVIVREPRNRVRSVTRYRVVQGEDYYGKFDAQAQATGYIDCLYKMKNRLARDSASDERSYSFRKGEIVYLFL